MADVDTKHPVSSNPQPISSQDVLDAVDREVLARRVLRLLKQKLRIQRDRLGHRDR